MKKSVLTIIFPCLTSMVLAQSYTMNIKAKDAVKSMPTENISNIRFEVKSYDTPPASESVLSDQINPYPERFGEEAGNRGKVVRMKYETKAYDTQETITKYALVYLPYGYDPDGIRRYNVFYMMHGMGDRFDTYLKAPGSTSELKRALDHMIQDGEIEPLIVVTPSFYIPDRYEQAEVYGGTANFPKELIEDLMPAVAKNYRTYATGTDPETFEATRSHRAFGGFSAGSVTCWNVFAEDFRYIREFVPMSGAQNLFNSGTADEIAARMAEIVTKNGYGPDDFYINAMSGSEDYAKGGLSAQIEAMSRQEMFTADKDKSKGNIYYREFSGGKHDYSATIVYIYNALINLFR